MRNNVLQIKKKIQFILKVLNTIKKKFFRSVGNTKIVTSENYIVEGENIIIDKDKGFITTDENAVIIDNDNNKIFLDNFFSIILEYIFKSVGYTKIEDKSNNVYEFSQLYIDTKKKEILGTDIKAFSIVKI